MFAIAFFESGFRPDATGGVGEKGLWQIYPKAWPDLDKKYDLYDPVQNSHAAAIVYRKQGLTAWSVYKARGSNPKWSQTVARGKAAMMRVSSASPSQLQTISATIPGIPDIPGLPNLPGLPDIPNPFDPNLPSVPNPLEGAAAVVDVIKFFTDPGNWLRATTFVGGGVLLILGISILVPSTLIEQLMKSPETVKKAATVIPQAKALKVAKVAK
jgi:hypothetical protein